MNNKGFTLMEMIVAVSIFSIVSVMVSELFIMSNRSQQKANTNQKVQSDTRVMMSQISDRIRSGTIDYNAYTAIVQGGGVLHLIDENSQTVTIQKSDTVFANTSCASERSTPCIELSEDGGTTFYPMTSENFKVNSLQFYIDPIISPEGTGPDIQPRVTYSMGIEPVSPTPIPGTTTYVQTTVSSRVYLR